MTAWMIEKSHRGCLRKIRKILFMFQISVTADRSLHTTRKAGLFNGFLSTGSLSSVASPTIHSWRIRHCHASLCRNRLAAIPYHSNILSNTSLSWKKPWLPSHVPSTSLQIAFRLLRASLSWFATLVKHACTIWCRCPSILGGHFTFSPDNIWITWSRQKRTTNASGTLENIIIFCLDPFGRCCEKQSRFCFPSLEFCLYVLYSNFVVCW